jgi:hypothetical protein
VTDCEGARLNSIVPCGHAHVVGHMLCLKESVLLRFPSPPKTPTRTWLFVVALATELVRWFLWLCFEDVLARGLL